MFSRSSPTSDSSVQLPALPPPSPLTLVNPQTVREVSVMDFNELLELKAHVDRELKYRGKTELAQLRDKLQAIAMLQGLSVKELMNPPKKREKRGITPKYRNPTTKLPSGIRSDASLSSSNSP